MSQSRKTAGAHQPAGGAPPGYRGAALLPDRRVTPLQRRDAVTVTLSPVVGVETGNGVV
jgi:hypothetical protein